MLCARNPIRQMENARATSGGVIRRRRSVGSAAPRTIAQITATVRVVGVLDPIVVQGTFDCIDPTSLTNDEALVNAIRLTPTRSGKSVLRFVNAKVRTIH